MKSNLSANAQLVWSAVVVVAVALAALYQTQNPVSSATPQEVVRTGDSQIPGRNPTGDLVTPPQTR